MRSEAASEDIRRWFAGCLLIYVKRFSRFGDSDAVFADMSVAAPPHGLTNGFCGAPTRLKA
jgi:hypothetical protein